MLTLQISGKSFPLTKNLTEQQLNIILDSYNSQSLQRMLLGRGQKVNPHKDANLKALARIFLDEKYLRKSLEALPEPGRQALARLVIRGVDGVLSYPALKQQLSARYGPDYAATSLQQLIANGLALYAFRNGTTLSFEGAYNKHTLETPGSLNPPYSAPPPGYEQVVWALPQVVASFKLDPTLEKELQPVPLKPFGGRAAPQLVESARFDTLLADLFTFSRYVEQNRPKVLQSGDLGKRDFTKLAGLFSFKDKPPPQEAKRLDELPHFNFLWQILLKTGLLRVDEISSEVLAGPQLSRFFQLPRHEQAQMLIKGWAGSELVEFTRIPTLRFYTFDPEEGSIPTLTKEQSGRNRLLSFLQELYQQRRLPQTGLESGWLDFSSLLAILKEEAYEILLPHSYQPETSSYGSYYSYRGDFGRGYYKGFVSKIKPPDPTLARNKYESDRTLALSLDRDWDWVEGEWVALMLGEAWNWLGLAEVGLDEKSRRPVAFRFTPSGLAALSGKPTAEEEAAQRQLAELAEKAPELARPLIVQPNFEIMVFNPVQNLPLVRRLEVFATQLNLGDVAQYRISKESVLQGLRSGLAVTEILKLLRDNSRVPVAQNIETSLLDWATAFERLVLQPDATVIEVGEAARLDRLLAVEPGLVLRRLGPNFALVAAGVADKVARRLATIKLETGTNPTLSKAKASAGNGAVPAAVVSVINTAQLIKGTLSFTDAFTLEVNNATPYQLYRLGQFADLVSWDMAARRAVFKLTAEAAGRAYRQSLTFAHIKQTCEGWLAAPTAIVAVPKSRTQSGVSAAVLQNRVAQPQLVTLPAETRLALKGWLGEYGTGEQPRLGHQSVMALQVPRSELLDDILAVPELKEALVGRIGPGLALVRVDRFEDLRQRLESFSLLFGEGIKLSSPSPAGILMESLPVQGQGQGGLDNALLAMFEQSFGSSSGTRGKRGPRGLSLSNVDIATLAAIMENDDNPTFADGDNYDEEDFDEGDEVIFLLEEIVTVMVAQAQTEKIKGDLLAIITGNRFAQEVLSRVEAQGYPSARKKNDLWWEDKHDDAHFYEDLTSRERREILLKSCLAAMTSEVQGQRQAAVILLPLYGTSIARQMTEFLYHPDPVVRYNACLVLGEVGDRESITHLQAVLDDQTPTARGIVATVARAAVGQIQKRF